MQKKYNRIIIYLLILVALFIISGCEEPIKLKVTLHEGLYTLKALDKFVPYTYGKNNTIGQVGRIEKANPKEFSILKELNLIYPYKFTFKLGNIPKEYTFLLNIETTSGSSDDESEQKAIYLDENGDGDITKGEKVFNLYRQKYADNIYFSTAEPIVINVPYLINNYQEMHSLSFVLYLILSPQQPSKNQFILINRNWFAGKITIDEEEIIYAIVDQNSNGKYDDKADYVYMDLNEDGDFTKDEGVTYGRLSTIFDATGKKCQLVLDSPYPKQANIMEVKK